MTSGWSNDQFFRANEGGENTSATPAGLFNPYIVASPANNPPFAFPGSNLRIQDKDGNVQYLKMQRGYIRTLMTEADGVALAMRKCQFQFNPQVLSTSVQMNESMINMLQQDIGQYSVPIAGNSNFAFQLMFDRSMELNVPGPGGGNVNGDTGLYTDLSPSDIGVFRDIGDLSAVIGAGINPSSVDYAKQVLAKQMSTQATAQKTDAAIYANATSLIDSFVGIGNVGNNAFLTPVPVRAVFSSLFIVEGYVTNFDVTYFKFNSALVPMQATVSLMMHATYIGYAKKKTFTTLSLDAQKTSYTDEKNSQKASATSTVQALNSGFSKIQLSLVNTLNSKYMDLTTLRTATADGLGHLRRPPVVLSWHTSYDSQFPATLASASTDDTSIQIDATWKVYGPSSSILSGYPATPFVNATVHTDVAAWSHLKSDRIIDFSFSEEPSEENPLKYPNVGKVASNVSVDSYTDTPTLPDGYYRFEVDVTIVVTPAAGPAVTGHGSYVSTRLPGVNTSVNLECRLPSVPLSWDLPVVPGADPWIIPPNRDGVFAPTSIPPSVSSGLSFQGLTLPGSTSTVGS